MVLYLSPDDAGRDGKGKIPHSISEQTQNAREQAVN